MGCKIVQFGKYAKFLGINLCYKCEETAATGGGNLLCVIFKYLKYKLL